MLRSSAVWPGWLVVSVADGKQWRGIVYVAGWSAKERVPQVSGISRQVIITTGNQIGRSANGVGDRVNLCLSAVFHRPITCQQNSARLYRSCTKYRCLVFSGLLIGQLDMNACTRCACLRMFQSRSDIAYEYRVLPPRPVFYPCCGSCTRVRRCSNNY